MWKTYTYSKWNIVKFKNFFSCLLNFNIGFAILECHSPLLRGFPLFLGQDIDTEMSGDSWLAWDSCATAPGAQASSLTFRALETITQCHHISPAVSASKTTHRMPSLQPLHTFYLPLSLLSASWYLEKCYYFLNVIIKSLIPTNEITVLNETTHFRYSTLVLICESSVC